MRGVSCLRTASRGHHTRLRARDPLTRATSLTASLGRPAHSEIVLTIGNSRTVERFLRAASTRTFQVIVAERAPWYDGQVLAARLAQSGIDTTVITDSAIFAMMARVNKVIIGTHAGTLGAATASHPRSTA